MIRDRDQEYIRFKTAVYFWLDKIGLNDWTVTVESVRLGRKMKLVYARVCMNWQNRVAHVQWNASSASLDEEPEDIAKHEVLHILLNACLNLAAHEGDVNACSVDAEEHGIIRRLMKLL